MDIRPATEEDAAAISALNRDVQQLHAGALPRLFKPPAPESFSPDKVRALAGQPGVCLLIGRIEGAPAGYAYAEIVRQGETALRLPMAYVYLNQLSVAPAFQRRGCGGRLLAAVVDFARAEGIDALHLDVWAFNGKAQAFFAKHGFTPFNLRMAKELT
jgi:ribosomal protein S18 acetylase RimI-like enzyme